MEQGEQKTRAELIDECTTLEDFQSLGETLGYKAGWATHVFEARQAKDEQE